jgi:hypothetical protein
MVKPTEFLSFEISVPSAHGKQKVATKSWEGNIWASSLLRNQTSVQHE